MQTIYPKPEVELARHVFGKWIQAAKRTPAPSLYLVEKIKTQGVGETLPEEFYPARAWSLSGNTLRVLDSEYRTLWFKHVEYMADAALAKDVQLVLV